MKVAVVFVSLTSIYRWLERLVGGSHGFESISGLVMSLSATISEANMCQPI